MKKYWIASLLCVLFLHSCKNDQAESAGEKPAESSSVAETSAGGTAAPALNPGDSREVQLLTKDFWVFEFYVTDDVNARQFNRGRWYSFKPDGTFESGHWEEKTGMGTWKLDRSMGKLLLQIDSENDAEDAEWEIQGINQSGDTMTWVGTPNYKRSDVIIKAINLLTRPTKKQFGVG
jgi:hypothetical protein